LAVPTTSPAGSGGPTLDRAGDMTPGYLDIVAMRVDAASASLDLALDLAAAVPPGSPSVGQLAYMFYLDIDGDRAWDVTVALKLVPEGGFRPSFIDRRSGRTLEGPQYPGAASLTGSTVSLTLRLEAIGCPPMVGVRAASQQTKGGSTAGDEAPDATGAWVEVATGCGPAAS
jgi:hypothetical protein